MLYLLFFSITAPRGGKAHKDHLLWLPHVANKKGPGEGWGLSWSHPARWERVMDFLLPISLSLIQFSINQPSAIWLNCNPHRHWGLRVICYKAHSKWAFLTGRVGRIRQPCSRLQVRFRSAPLPLIPRLRLKGLWPPGACSSPGRLQEWERASQIPQTRANPVVPSWPLNIPHDPSTATCLSPKTKSHRLYRERWKRHTQVTKAMGIKSRYREGERLRNNNPILSLSQPSEFSYGKLDEIASFSPRNDKQFLILAKRISKLLSRKARHMGPTLPTHSLNHIQSVLETPQSHHSF